jgi:hypothetical protein
MISAKINRLAKVIGYSSACKEMNRRSQIVRGCKAKAKPLDLTPKGRIFQKEFDLFVDYP